MSVASTTLDEALEHYRLAVGSRRGARRDRRIHLAAIDVLREFLVDNAGLGGAEELRAADVKDLLLDSLLRDPDATPAVVEKVAAVLGDFARWAGAGGRLRIEPGVVELAARLGEEVARMLAIAAALRDWLRGGATPGVEVTTPEGAVVGVLSAGTDRIVRPGEVDLTRAEEDWFVVTAIEGTALWLQSVTGSHLGEGPRGPVPVPVAVAARLRVGDALLVEVAPAGERWELLEIWGAYPGGFGWPALGSAASE